MITHKLLTAKLYKIIVSFIVITLSFIGIYYKINSKAGYQDYCGQLYEQGVAAHDKGDDATALHYYKEAFVAAPLTSKLLLRTGIIFGNHDKHEQAIHFLNAALALDPTLISGYIALGNSLLKLKKYQEAIEKFTIAITHDKNCFDGHMQISTAYCEIKEFEKALQHAVKANQLQPTNIHTVLNIGHIFNKHGDLDQATTYYKKAITMDPYFANAHYNLGFTLRLMKKIPEAMHHLQKALELKPNYVDAHVCLAQCYWGLENFKDAWPEYNWRWKMTALDPNNMSVPLWSGQDLKGKTILLYAEQGLGDTLQFIRFAQLVKEKGARVIVRVQKPLIQLLSSYPYIDGFFNDAELTAQFDYQAPLLNLPGILKIAADKIPAPTTYLKADPSLITLWKKRLAADTHFKIGLCWHVDPIHEIDKSPWEIRSFPIKLFKQLSKIPGLSFYSLQKINGEEQLQELPDSFKIHTFGPQFDAVHGRFMDSAAVIMNLDLIITVDTSIAHLAAGLGKKVWMLLPYAADCRWYDNRTDTPWYPTMRLFRQPKPYDWDSVSKAVEKALTMNICFKNIRIG